MVVVRCEFGGGVGSASALEVAEGVEVVLESRAPECECKVGREIAQEPNMGGPARQGLCAKVDRGGEEVRMEERTDARLYEAASSQ